MAFDFLSKFSKGELERLRTYLQSQLDNADMQINHMIIEVDKLQKTVNKLMEYANSKGIVFKIFGTNFNRKHEYAYNATDSLVLVQQIKQPYYRNIKHIERIEFNIKKMMDKVEQMQEQVYLLRISKSEFRANIDKINSLFDGVHTQLTVEKISTV